MIRRACQAGRVECVRLLVAGGACVDKHGEHGRSPLFVACRNGNAACAELLSHAGAALACEAGPSLQAAHRGGNAACVSLLLTRAEAEARAAAASLLAEEEVASLQQRAHATSAYQKKLKPSRRAGKAPLGGGGGGGAPGGAGGGHGGGGEGGGEAMIGQPSGRMAF